ncbi:MAG: DUF2157 domain-containing protein [Planctomycetota bacterium]|nr:DUF2157 domain-containing protein [Planctomycetota bacterium]
MFFPFPARTTVNSPRAAKEVAMAGFVDKLGEFLGLAETEGMLDSATRDRLIQLARSREKPRHFGRLAHQITFLGATGLVIGFILLVGANWFSISPTLKLALFLTLFAVCHAAGLILRWRGGASNALAESLSFLGCGLFLGGLALVTQIFHLNTNPAHGLRVWCLATIPLALLLRSTPLAGLATLSACLWYIVWGGDYFTSNTVYAASLLLLPACLLGLAGLAGHFRHMTGVLFRTVGGFLLALFLYFLGFFRHFNYATRESKPGGNTSLILFSSLAILLLVLGEFTSPRPDRASRLALLLFIPTLLLDYAGLAVYSQTIEPGETLSFYSFGTLHSYDWHFLAINIAAAVLWFVWCIWLVWAGVRREKDWQVILGIYGTALGFITRYFDLIGSLEETGVSFLAGGALLLVLGWGAEKCRRRLLAKTA